MRRREIVADVTYKGTLGRLILEAPDEGQAWGALFRAEGIETVRFKTNMLDKYPAMWEVIERENMGFRMRYCPPCYRNGDF